MSDVLIVGAGPTGLTLACELAKRGISFTLIDKASGPSLHSKALAIQTRTLEIFDRMGIVDQFLQQGLIVKHFFIYQDGKGIDIPLVGIDSLHPYVLILPQADTERLLYEHLKILNGQSPVDIHWNTSFEGFENDLALIRTPQGLEKKKFSYTVGCDGAHSSVRHALNIPFEGVKLKETFYLTDVKLGPSSDGKIGDDKICDEKGPHIFFDQEGICLIVPFHEPQMYRLILPADRNGYGTRLEKFSIIDTLWQSEFTIHRRIAHTFSKGSVFLAGDAAHVHSPAGGQGMNTSIQDAYNLGWKLALVLKNKASSNLLKTYEIERKPIALKVLKGTTIATHIVTLFQTLKNPLFFKIIAWMVRQKEVLHHLTQGISQSYIRYRSPIIMDSFAGKKAPDVIMADGKRLFEHIKSDKHILLLFDVEGSIYQNSDLVDVFVIKDRNVSKKYKATAGSMVMIRPDGYIGMRSCNYSVKKIELYFYNIMN